MAGPAIPPPRPAGAGAGAQAPGGPPAPARGRAGPDGQAWIITFTDLVALLLAFFVMLFAMSTLEDQQWRSLVDSLAENLNAVGVEPVAVPMGDLDMPAVHPAPGTDLDYLGGLLGGQIAAVPGLARAAVRRADDRVVVALPADLLFPPDGARLDARAAAAVLALGGVLRNVPNRIEVAGHADPRPPGPGFASNWELSLLRARAVAAALARAGTGGPIVARGYGAGRFRALPEAWPIERRRALARRVDVVIHASAREAPP